MQLKEYLRGNKITRDYVAKSFDICRTTMEYFVKNSLLPSHYIVNEIYDFTEGCVTYEDFYNEFHEKACEDLDEAI